jgi:hypothetical protein
MTYLLFVPGATQTKINEIEKSNCKTKNFLHFSKGRTHGLTLNGNGEPQVDMLDIPGKGRCCVFMARFSYDPPE